MPKRGLWAWKCVPLCTQTHCFPWPRFKITGFLWATCQYLPDQPRPCIIIIPTGWWPDLREISFLLSKRENTEYFIKTFLIKQQREKLVFFSLFSPDFTFLEEVERWAWSLAWLLAYSVGRQRDRMVFHLGVRVLIERKLSLFHVFGHPRGNMW